MNNKYILLIAALLLTTVSTNAQVKIYGNVYGGGEKAQVIAPDIETVKEQLIQNADLATLFTKEHTYTTYVRLGEKAEIYGRTFGGGMGHEDLQGESAGRVTGQTDVVLDGATVWSEIFGGGEMADVRGNTLVHFKKGKAGHNAFGGGLGKLGGNDSDPDNKREVLASADIKKIPANYNLITDDTQDNIKTLKGLALETVSNWLDDKITGESFVVFDGDNETYTHYEFMEARTLHRDSEGKVVKNDNGYYFDSENQYDSENTNQLFSIDHNIYGGGMTASQIDGKTFVHINYGMVNEEMLTWTGYGRDGIYEPVWTKLYNSIANAQFCVFGGGYGYHSQVNGDTYVTMDIMGSGEYRYINAFTEWFADEGKDKYHWDTNTGTPENIYKAADEATWSHGAPGRSCMDVIGGGYNGRVLGTTNITIGGDVIVRKVYGGGYYASVGNTNVNIHSGIFNRVYGGGLIGNVYGTATLNIGQVGTTDNIIKHNTHLMVKDAIYGGNDVSGTVGTGPATNVTRNGVTYHVYSPVDDDYHGVRMNIYGGLVLGDVYGAGNGNHPGYGNPDYMEFDLSQHPSENYRTLAHAGTNGTTHVYKYRPRTGRVVMNLQGNSGTNFNDEPLVDKVRIWGRTFGGGNSCNVGIWDGQEDDNTEVYAETGSWHPGDNFTGQGTITVNIGSHVQFGNRNDSHETPNGLFMGCNGEHMITQHLDKEKAKYYHQYWDSKAKCYYPGFVVYEDDAVTPIKRTTGLKAFKAFINNILTKSDNVTLNIDNDAQDVWMSNFVGGGYRGSMQAYSETGSFDYTLPEGVTIGHSVVGGAFNAHIIYRVYATEYGDGTYKTDADGNYIYETVEPKGTGSVISKAEAEEQGLADYDYIKKLYAEGHEGDEDYKTGYLRYNFDGGMLAHDSEMNATNTGSRIHKVHNPTDYENADFTASDGYIANKNKAMVHLELKNRLHPIVNEATETTPLNVHGGIVYGGCFLTGFVEGDSWVDYDCSLSPLCTDPRFFNKENTNIYDEVADLTRNNALNVFGAGYGADTHSMGDVYLCIKSIGNKASAPGDHDSGNENSNYPFIYNAFGGGNMGTVAGSTNVYYDGGKQGTMLGSLYGGGYKGDIDGNTFVELVQGFLVNVYGGSRQANIKGAAHVWAYDGSTRAATGLSGEGKFNHLIICNMYGGNDISGTISGTMPAIWSKTAWPALEGKVFNSYIQVAGTNPGEKGFPLVGNLYGGGNGEGWSAELGDAPNVEKSFLEIDGGTTLSAFGGGNKATITDDAWILVNASGAHFADVTFTDYQKAILENKFFKGVLTGYNWNGDELIMSEHHVDNIFGGNNVATMAIQPTWNLKAGKIGNVYSGGNMGDMTYYNPSPAKDEPKGLSITVDSDKINIESLYGGCRMSDVKATLYTKDSEGNVTDETPQTFGTDEYGATVNVKKGHIGNVYGGNDISGYVYNGTNVNLSGSITGNVYGAGNGNYLYAYDKTTDHDKVGTKSIAEVWNDEVKQYVYWIPGAAEDSNLKQLVSLTNVRPHVSKAYLNINGTNSEVGKKVYIFGSVYCGGNASTIRSRDNGNADAHVKFNIGDNVIVNEVFMGSNGASMKYDANDKDNTYLTDFEKVNGLDLSADMTDANWTELLTMYGLSNDKKDLIKTIYPNLLSVYMSAVDMKAMPLGFTEFSGHEFQNTWIGTFCMGGNAGSMMTDRPVDIVFPQSLNFFGRIIGGSKDASFQYKGKWHRGGFRMPLAADAKLKDDKGVLQSTKSKLRMKIRGDWYSRRMIMEEEYKTAGTYAPVGDYLVIDKTNDGVTWDPAGKAWHDGCNVYGGCYQSGDMVGDVEIYIESDMLAYSDPRYHTTIDEYQNQELVESNKLNIPVANVYGAGYGPESRSFGDAYIYMKDIPNVEAHHPSVNNLFGGGRNGMLVGNSVIHVHDGLVFKDVVGGSFAAPMYGSAQVTVGYPKFYVCKQTGEYFLDRADKWNDYNTKGKNGSEKVVKKSIKYFEGTYVPCNVYEQITGVKPYYNNEEGALVTLNADNKSTYFEFHDEYNDSNTNPENYFPEGGWDNVEIRVRGGVYGGGFSLSNSTSAIAGTYTTLASTAEYNHGNDSQGNSSVGFGGNSSIIITDQGTTKDHIKISSETTEKDEYDNVVGEYTGVGGVYGDGRLVFCEGFRTAELNGYGYAEHKPSEPLMLNSLQRFDLLTVNDCCFKLYGDQDFATDEINSQKYSLARIGELRMNSSIDATGTYAVGDLTSAKTRNYIGFFNNIHYLGAIVTNDDFHKGKFHNEAGAVDNTNTYYSKKQEYITNYNDSDKGEAATNTFKLRNYATARNMVGINSGYCLRVENLYYNGDERDTYYGPIVGVAEVKLLNVQPGEGGGYVYADNIHADIYESGHSASDATFMNESGNFVFEGVVRPGDAEGEKQFIVDDCLPVGFDEWNAPSLQGRAGGGASLPEQHYWYVIGDTYYYNSTLTAYSYKDAKTFDLTKSDANIIFGGIEDGSEVSLQSVQWQAATYPDGYTGDIRGFNSSTSDADSYKFTLQVGNNTSWSADMPRSTTTEELITGEKTWTPYNNANTTPRFNIHLLDNVNNCPVGSEETYFNDHLSVPERVKLVVKSRKGDEVKTYNVTLEIVYLQGPSFTGNVNITNCALPGEHIGFNSKDIQIKTTQQLPVTSYGWKLVPVVNDEAPYRWQDANNGITIPASYYRTSAEGYLEGSIPALYSQNHWNILYTFKAGGETFTVAPTTNVDKPLSERMLVVHNYHKMADITDANYDVNVTDGSGNLFSKALKAGARIYIADAADLKAFMNYVNAENTGEDLNFYLQDNLTLPADWSINKDFAGTLHGDGYVLTMPTDGTSVFGDHLKGKTINLGVANGEIATVPEVYTSGIINSFDNNTPEADKRYGKSAYNLSHYHNEELNPAYVAAYYAGEDWRYARIYEKITNDKYLRTKAPNYGNTQTSHNIEHADEYTPVEHDYLFFGQTLTPTGDTHPVHIADNEANRVYEAEGYYNSKNDEGFYYNVAEAWAMQPGLTAIRFDNTKSKTEGEQRVPSSIGSMAVSADDEADYTKHVTRNLLVFEADDATKAAESKNFFHVKGNKGDNAYNNTQNVFILDNMPLVDKEDFNAPYSFTATNASYVRTPAHFVETPGTAWESICLPFSPTTATLSTGIERHEDGHGNGRTGTQTEITFFYGDKDDGNHINHEYWLRELKSVEEPKGTTTATFVRPSENAFVAYKPYIVSFPGARFYEFDMTDQTITFSKAGAVITVTDDATKYASANGYTYTGAFKNEAASAGKYVMNPEGSSFVVNGAVIPFRGWMDKATGTLAKSRAISIGGTLEKATEDWDMQHGDPGNGEATPAQSMTAYVVNHDIVITSTYDADIRIFNAAGQLSRAVHVLEGENLYTGFAPGVYIVNGKKLVVK